MPERIHITWNAADGYEEFLECGIRVTQHDTLTPDQITAVLARQKGRLFRLMGWVEDPSISSVTLRIDDYNEEELQVVNCDTPQFNGTFVVAAEPLPYRSQHGDYIFDLIKADQHNASEGHT